MGFFSNLFKKKGPVLPCESTGECPYEYDQNPGRDIEGMPFVDDDPRSCPVYGHICPEFMGDFGLTPEELKIRAVIHCAQVRERQAEEGETISESAEFRALMERYEELKARYPEEEYPQYY